MLPLLALVAMSPTTLSLTPKETVWVYANASTPGDGTFLRAWGVDGKSCPPEGEDAGQFSFSYLKWDLSDLPKNSKLASAKLILNGTPDPGYTLEATKKSPVEVRPIVGEFSAKTWTFDMSAKIRPNNDAKSIFGSGYPTKITADAPVPVTIDLMAGPNNFAKTLAASIESSAHTLSLSITAALDPSADGRAFIYKFYGQNEPKETLRPQLVLRFE